MIKLQKTYLKGGTLSQLFRVNQQLMLNLV